MARRKIKAGSTSVTVPLFVQDTSSSEGAGLGSLAYNTSGLAAKYRREGQSSWTTISLVTATVGTYTSGGFIADGGPVTGGYEFGVPNAVLAAGAKWAEVVLYGATNMLPVLLEFELDAVDYQDSAAFGLSRLDAAVSSVTVEGGVNPIAYTYTVYEDDGTTPLEGCAVYVSSDSDGDTRSATRVTDALGRVVFELIAGTYYFWRSHPDWNFSDPDTEVISA